MNRWRRLVAAGALLLLLLLAPSGGAQVLPLPPRPADAPGGAEFAQSLIPLDLATREIRIGEQIRRGNAPEFLRHLVPLQLESVTGGQTNRATCLVTPDYLAVGSDVDYFLTPLTPGTAQRIADFLHCSLPTRKLVDEIFRNATVKLTPSPIPPSAAMTTVPVFLAHNQTVLTQRREQFAHHPLGELVAGHKKDVVLFAQLGARPGKVGIYGWHQPDGHAIQPLYTGHAGTWADYSHGVRLVQLSVTVNGQPTTLPEALANPNLAPLFSDEGVVPVARYATNAAPVARLIAPRTNQPSPLTIRLEDFHPAAFGEREVEYHLEPEVTVRINAPGNFDPAKPLDLILFTLPNGNTIDQTIGHTLAPGDDWHYDIQHIGAQTRFVRERLADRNLVVVYLEAGGRSWPAWRKRHADQPRRIPEMVNSIQAIFTNAATSLTLSGHSGGGSFIFGYLNGVDRLPDQLTRIAFLDSNYAFDPAQGHTTKLAQWLQYSDRHRLIVLAYNDAVALLNGTNFVSAAGGTWGRSHMMIGELGKQFAFTSQTNAGLQSYSALGGRIAFFLKENPQQEIFHTVQVERNGFIHCLLLGTPFENRDYDYFGPRAYTRWIAARSE